MEYTLGLFRGKPNPAQLNQTSNAWIGGAGLLGEDVNPRRLEVLAAMGHQRAGRAYLCLAAGLLAGALRPALTSAQQQAPPPAQSQQPATVPAARNGQTSPPETEPSSLRVQHGQQMPGTISGTVVDQTGTAVAGAQVTLSCGDQPRTQDALSDDDGLFSFVGVAPGPFQLTVSATSFAPQSVAGILQPGETDILPQIALALATESTSVEVVAPRAEIAEAEIKEEEHQRVFGVVPNFYVTYDPRAVPLSPKQKFELAWRTTIDPVTFAATGAVAGIQQADDDFSGYGQGARGFAKRYGASYADAAVGAFIGGAMLPSLLKQDPRYFYKGIGSKKSRFLYAIANSVICKGDNGRWQPDYSGILGSLAAGGISNLYYPPQNREGLELTLENTLIGIGESAGENLLQEFVIPKLRPKLANRNPTPPSTNSAN
jgi:hypothetical protein